MMLAACTIAGAAIANRKLRRWITLYGSIHWGPTTDTPSPKAPVRERSRESLPNKARALASCVVLHTSIYRNDRRLWCGRTSLDRAARAGIAAVLRRGHAAPERGSGR